MKYRLLGERIKKERIENNLTQERLAERANLSVSFLGQIERGDRKPSLETVVNIANALGVTADLLLQDSYKKMARPVSFKQATGTVDFLLKETAETDFEAAMAELAQHFKKRRPEEISEIFKINRLIIELLDNNKQ